MTHADKLKLNIFWPFQGLYNNPFFDQLIKIAFCVLAAFVESRCGVVTTTHNTFTLRSGARCGGGRRSTKLNDCRGFVLSENNCSNFNYFHPLLDTTNEHFIPFVCCICGSLASNGSIVVARLLTGRYSSATHRILYMRRVAPRAVPAVMHIVYSLGMFVRGECFA